MIETFLVAHPFVAVGVWVLLFISDYYLTLWGAREYRRNARAHIELGGSYELEPRFQKAIDELRHISPQIASRLLLFAAGLLLLWWLSVRNAGNPAFFLVGFGAYALTQVVVQMRHIRNIVSFRALGVPDAVTGHIKYSRWVTRRISNVDLLLFAALYALCYALSGRVIFIGGVLGCLSVVRRHVAAARLERNGIRRALPADAVSVARIHVESWKIAYRGIMPDDVIARTDVAYRTTFWKERIADTAWPVFLLEERGVPLAFCQIIASRDGDDDAARVAHITSLHVLPQLRGRGHGRALLDHAIAEIRRRGLTELTLWVLEANQPARRFYEKHGFSPDGGTRKYSKTQVPEVRYRIRLPDSMRSGASPTSAAAHGAVTFPDHFSGVSAAYAEFRPRYPDALFAFLAREAPARDAAWDAGTGSGQAAAGLARHFRHVTATDASAAQIESAAPQANVSYRVGPAEVSGLDDASIDLVTAAQAVHWFDRPRFWAEARRVLRPRGVMAIWCYGLFEISPLIDAITLRFYSHVVGPYWPPERRHVEAGYQTIDFPFAEFPAPAFAIEQRLTLEDVAGYIRTWSATRTFMKERREDPVDGLMAELAAAWGPPQQSRLARWPLAMRVGRT